MKKMKPALLRISAVALAVIIGSAVFLCPLYSQRSMASSKKELLKSGFKSRKISANIWKRINGSSYKKNKTITRSSLRYLTIPHYGFDGKIHLGEMIVNKKIAGKTLAVFKELFKAEYQIEKMHLIDDYGSDDERSMSDNNSSAFNYRTISGTNKLSNHALGLAIDINPLYNPYVTTRKGRTVIQPADSKAYADRDGSCNYLIRKNDICVKTFRKYGFDWGGDWKNSKDYQHFEYTGK